MINTAMELLGRERSAIRELFEQGKILKEKYGKDSVFDFSIGNSSVRPPSIVNKTLINLLTNTNNESVSNIHGYTSADGDKEVRESIAKYLNETYGAEVNGDLIYMTVGAAAGLAITLKALVDSSANEILIFAPYFPEYAIFTNNASAKLCIVKPDFNSFLPDIDDLNNKITSKTKAVIINSPNNPTGVLYKEDTIKNICSVLKNKEKEYGHKIYLISDEPYRELIYTDDKYPFVTNYYDDSIITYSFSKSLSLPGERIGYILVNPKCNNAHSVFAAIAGSGRSLGYVCAPSLFQYLIPHILGNTVDISIYKNNAKYLYETLSNIGYKVIKPDGAFYLFVKSLEEDDQSFSKKALEHQLLLVPSKSFGISGYIRIAYCISESQIKNSIIKFKELYNSYYL